MTLPVFSQIPCDERNNIEGYIILACSGTESIVYIFFIEIMKKRMMTLSVRLILRFAF